MPRPDQHGPRDGGMPDDHGMPPSIGIVVGVLVRDGEVLLVRRTPDRRFYPDMWDLFGGHVEEGESAEDALLREGREELRVDIESLVPLGTGWDPVERVEYAVFSVASWRGEPVNAAPDEHSEIGWFSLDAFPRSPALDLTREFVVRAMASGADGSLDPPGRSLNG